LGRRLSRRPRKQLTGVIHYLFVTDAMPDLYDEMVLFGKATEMFHDTYEELDNAEMAIYTQSESGTFLARRLNSRAKRPEPN
jgi:hypothetical protein